MLFEKIEMEESEVVLATVRKHWFVILSELFVSLFMILLPLLIFFLYKVSQLSLNIEVQAEIDNYLPFLTYFFIVWLLLAVLTGFTIWTHYFLDLWVITDRRIIVIDQIHFFNRKVSSFRLERLQDIKVVIKGIIPTFLNFGTIEAQTASSAESNFSSRGLPDPRALQATIQKAMDERLRLLHINN